MREPYSSYTPIRESLWSKFPAKSLLLSGDLQRTKEQIAKFSSKDAAAYEEYEKLMSRFVNFITYLLDNRPPNLNGGRLHNLKSILPLLKAARELRLRDIPEFHELLTASAAKVLDKWFESEPLKSSLATDAITGSMSGPYSNGSGYVLLHHVMGGVEGKPSEWAFAEGGMGAVSAAIGNSASALGASIFTGEEIQEIVFKKEGGTTRATGVVTTNGKETSAKLGVFSNATPEVTFKKLVGKDLGRSYFGEEFMNSVEGIDYASPVTKINGSYIDSNPQLKVEPLPFTFKLNHLFLSCCQSPSQLYRGSVSDPKCYSSSTHMHHSP